MVNIQDIIFKLNSNSAHLPINKKDLEKALDVLVHRVLFPICIDDESKEEDLSFFYHTMLNNIKALIDKEQAEAIIDSFMIDLPQLKQRLYKEAKIFHDNDPAAKSVEEVIIAYPGFFALCVYRISNIFCKAAVPIIPRVFSEYAHSKVGIDINPGAEIGHSFYIDHGTGIVIGETTIIGNNVKIYQGVTIGALFVTKDLRNEKRHPTIEDNVVIYAGATILGGCTVIGHDSVIGGNAWLTKSVPPYSQVLQNVEITIRSTRNESK